MGKIRKRNGLGIWALLLLSLAWTGRAKANSCEDLKQINLPDVRITNAASVDPSPVWTLPSSVGTRQPLTVSKPFCRVEGIIETEIGFEVWLPPTSGWNGKYLGTGEGGLAGVENYRDMARGVERGYAAASTDTGHKITDHDWMLGDPERLVNLGYRSNHLLQDRAKKIIAAYYSMSPKHAYFIGCSGGGRQAMKEAQQFPDDYDGIISGTPAPLPSIMSVRNLWEGVEMLKSRPVTMSPADWQLVADAGMKSCNSRVIDGVAEDPRSCTIDWSALECNAEGHTRCLSAEQIKIAQTIYGPFTDENGKRLDPGMTPGSKPSISIAGSGGMIGELVTHNLQWNPLDLRVADILPAFQKAFPDWDINDSNLEPFKKRRGRLIGYQGWVDPIVLPQNTVNGYLAVEKTVGSERATRDFYRLFMVPGMGHCGGGAGADKFGGSGENAPVVDPEHDLFSALEDWVERGKAPDRIIASKVVDSKIVLTRPLCAYPEQAEYSGTGTLEDASNFKCVRSTLKP